jgi:hypothetical protein
MVSAPAFHDAKPGNRGALLGADEASRQRSIASVLGLVVDCRSW